MDNNTSLYIGKYNDTEILTLKLYLINKIK
jgi:hypothetical protein